MSKVLREWVVERFERETLAPEQLAVLRARLSSAAAAAAPLPQRRLLLVTAAVAATVLLILLMAPWSRQPGIDLPQRIAEEVAGNHLKMKPLELESRSMAAVADFFTQLDFNPVNSRVFALNEDELLGGRYCSIQGITAAQLRYRDEQGRTVTLYQTAYDPQRFSTLPDVDRGETPLIRYAKGLKVTLWVEKDLLFVAAEGNH